ncbi:Hypothetical_protein [Hexamita inflata]|uniref:Hypothetical_protein n=1 Tax=Hexamita inflata TaxID=28002 RepID=A0AA86RBZ8_9EUKA|nr:Hypothetical protein HINF_LOCUS62871 [Hexamita inflata]
MSQEYQSQLMQLFSTTRRMPQSQVYRTFTNYNLVYDVTLLEKYVDRSYLKRQKQVNTVFEANIERKEQKRKENAIIMSQRFGTPNLSNLSMTSNSSFMRASCVSNQSKTEMPKSNLQVSRAKSAVKEEVKLPIYTLQRRSRIEEEDFLESNVNEIFKRLDNANKEKKM